MKTQTFKNRKIAVMGGVSLLMGALIAGETQAGAMKADFNGDGYEDLVVGVPNEDIGGIRDAGAVKIVYGRADGTWRPHSQTTYLHQTKSGESGINLEGIAQTDDKFGSSIAVGDFDDDGYDDLAISSIGEDYSALGKSYKDSGVVNIVYGSSAGLTITSNIYLHLAYVANGSFLHANSQFGVGLAVGDYNGDNVDDLAVSYMNKATTQNLYGGGVVVYFGERIKGLEYRQRVSPKVRLVPQPRNITTINQATKFGYRLASGDFNNDGYDDLAVSAYEDKVGTLKTGSVYVAFGVADWNRRRGATFSHKIVPYRRNNEGRFGYAMAVGNFKGDSRDELAIGIPYSNRSGKTYSGEVVVVSFNPNGNTYQSSYYQSLPNIPGSSKRADQFGESLAATDFNDDGYDDLAIGIPAKNKENWGLDDAGSGEVVVLQGARGDLYRAQRFNQASPGIEGSTEDFDFFGRTLSSGDFNNDGYPDLLVGVQQEDLGSLKDAGVVQMIWGHPLAVLTPSVPGQQLFHQGSFSRAGFGYYENEVSDQFGGALLP